MKRAKQFRPTGAPTRQEQKRQADRWRGSASERGYNHRWSKASKTHLARSPLCVGCEALGRVEPATLVDHVDPHHGDPDKFWDTSMWQASCKWHHDSVKQHLEILYAHGRIPLSELWLNSETAIRVARGMRCDEVEG
ncbi:HNH endonuclease [Ensifer sp. 1H6]|nr:HNH endonuclease [Ensifer sp. 1H6]